MLEDNFIHGNKPHSTITNSWVNTEEASLTQKIILGLEQSNAALLENFQ